MSKNPPRAGLSVLVVDDNIVHRRMSQTILTAAGYTVTLAEGGAQALRTFEQSPPDVVLLDIHMPGMDGFETCRRIRALPTGKATPVLFVTDVSDLRTPDDALASGADDFLNKPISRIELQLRLRSLLRTKHQEELTRVLLEGTTEPILTFQASGALTTWNHPAEALFGFTRDEALGQDVATLIIAPECRPAHAERLKQLLDGEAASGGPRTALTARHKSGRLFPIELTLHAARSGPETTICGFVRSTSSGKQE